MPVEWRLGFAVRVGGGLGRAAWRYKRATALLSALALLGVGFVLARPAIGDDVFVSLDATPDIALKGGLRVFWNIHDGTNGATTERAIAKGYSPILVASSIADYGGDQRGNIRAWLAETDPHPWPDPWSPPPYFETVVKRDIARWPERPIYVHDFEFEWQRDPKIAWSHSSARRSSGISNRSDFEDAYFEAWADWIARPLAWSREIWPEAAIGVYDVQPFRRQYDELEIEDGAPFSFWQESNMRLWPHIDPHVDFYVAGAYFHRDTPDSIYYMARNVEGAARRSAELGGNKPVYTFVWFRFHQGNPWLSGRVVPVELAEAMALVPFFSGGRGVVLWGWEPEATTVGAVPYASFSAFADALARLATRSASIAEGELKIDVSAQELWREKKALVRRIEVGPKECIVLALQPWQRPDQTAQADVPCGDGRFTVDMNGRRATMAHIIDDEMTYF